MNNLHRELAPISSAAWSQIEQEAARTIKRHLAGRRVVDVHGPGGDALSAVGTGHIRDIEAVQDGVLARQRQVKALVELGAEDSDWQPVKDASRQIAFAEDRSIFEGYPAAGITGVRTESTNPSMTLPADVRDYPAAVAEALGHLRRAGVDGPYSVVLSADAYTAVSETSDHGYPVSRHIERLISGKIVWAPAIDGVFVLTTRGGDFALHLGQDTSIGYLAHDADAVQLYLQETMTFVMLTGEAAVALAPAQG
jgi:uncharacterized linocin/CFP29 family protein